MPKEYIYSMDHGKRVVFEDGTATLIDEDGIKVGWSKDHQGIDLAIVDMAKDIDGFEAKHINLDRDGANRLIRTIRKARDQAFGADA